MVQWLRPGRIGSPNIGGIFAQTEISPTLGGRVGYSHLVIWPVRPWEIIQNGVNIQDGDLTFSYQSVWAILESRNLKFWILIENYITANDTSVFFYKLSISSGIELELGTSRIKGFFYYISSHLEIEFRVNLMIYFGSSEIITKNKKIN
jgi:hypothetical protein